jgi:hypothetical protein
LTTWLFTFNPEVLQLELEHAQKSLAILLSLKQILFMHSITVFTITLIYDYEYPSKKILKEASSTYSANFVNNSIKIRNTFSYLNYINWMLSL